LRLVIAVTAQIGQAVENARLRDLAAEIQVRHALVAAQSQFVADVSHEFRSPLGLVRSAAQSLLSTEIEFPAEMRHEMLRIVDLESAHLERLVENLLDLSRVGPGGAPLSRRATDIIALAGSATGRPELHVQGHEIAVLAEPEELWIDVDSGAVSRVLTNLLSNAVKYSPPGSRVTVHVSADRHRAVISVADEGIGIAPEHQEHIFERFYRVADERTAHVRGVGLGLAVCKDVVEAHGGQISVQSAPGAGSAFTFWLPRKDTQRSERE
jgi:two-component system sensor histidine kinase KdpD